MEQQIKPDVKLESDYIKIVYEVITSNLRTNKKIIEKELNSIVNKIIAFKKKPSSIKDYSTVVKSLLKRLKELKAKVSIDVSYIKYNAQMIEEEKTYNNIQERLQDIRLIEGANYSFDNLKLFYNKKINSLILDFFLREKFLETAKHFIVDEKISVRMPD